MRRFLPAPLLSASLFAMWLMLNTLSIAHAVLGALLAIAIPVLSEPLRPFPVRIRRPGVVLRLILAVGHDVVVSNFQVARGVLRSRWAPPNAAFLHIPLEVRDTNALAALTMITTVIPGTIWSELAMDRRLLILHVFEVPDAEAYIAHFKERYERPLMEIFE